MELTVTRTLATETNLPVCILRLQGRLDGSNYEQVIAGGKQLFDSGDRRLLVDLSGVDFMSSAGLVSLHSLVLIYRGQPLPDLESGWGALSSIDNEEQTGRQNFVKLLNPQPRIANTLKMSGMDSFIEVFDDEQAALQSFAA